MTKTNSEPTTALETLGTYLSGDEPRDAIHLAVVPLVAKEKLFPGQHLSADGSPSGETVGIVDPFLPGPVMPGQRFWLVLYPRTITGLHHVWTHPAFPDGEISAPVADIEASEKWLRAFVESADCPTYETLMAGLRGEDLGRDDPEGFPGYFNCRWEHDYLHFGGLSAHGEIPPEFWDHVSVVLGREIPSTQRPAYFSCSC